MSCSIPHLETDNTVETSSDGTFSVIASMCTIKKAVTVLRKTNAECEM